METPDSSQESLGVKTPLFGLDFKGSSTQLLTVILCVAIAFALGYLITQHDAHSNENAQTQSKASSDTKEAVEKNTRALHALIYVVSLPEKERGKLNLSKPQELRDMERD